MAARANPVLLVGPTRGLDGRGILAKARDPLVTDARFGDFWINTVTKHLFGPKGGAGWPDNGLIRGANGWYALTRTVTDGTRRVRQIYDWIGGEGTKPAVNVYEGASGLTAVLADAADVRGPQGPQALINALAARTATVNYKTLTAVGEVANDNEKTPLERLFQPSARLVFKTLAQAQAEVIPAYINQVEIADLDVLRKRVNTEPAGDTLWKHRSADRFLTDGSTDSANGGWWQDESGALDARLVPPLAMPYKNRGKYGEWTIRDFGNKLCGRADNLSTADEGPSLRAAAMSGYKVAVPPGRYPLRSFDPAGPSSGSGQCAVYSTAPVVDLDFAADAKIMVGPTVDGSKGLFQFLSSEDPSDNPFSLCRLNNMAIDATGAAVSGTGLRLVDILGYNRVEAKYPRMGAKPVAPSGVSIGYGAADTGLNITRCQHIAIEHPWMFGFGDCGIYINGNPDSTYRDKTDGIGESLQMIGGEFYRCLNGFASKRDFMQQSLIGGIYKECVNGISAGSTDGGPNDFARGWTIIGPRMFKMQGRPIFLQSGARHLVSDFHIEDFGLWISDQSQITAATIGGINLAGVRGASFSNGYIGFKEWNLAALPGGIAGSTGPHGVIFITNTETSPDPEVSTDNTFVNVHFEKVYHAFRESAGSDRNTAIYTAKDVVAANLIAGGSTSTFAEMKNVVSSGKVIPIVNPVLSGSTGDASSYDLRNGNWTQSGKAVTFGVYIDLMATTGLNGNVSVTLTGAPLATSAPTENVVNFTTRSADITHTSSAYTEFFGAITGGTNVVTLYEGGSGVVPLPLTAARFGANARVSLNGTYMTA